MTSRRLLARLLLASALALVSGAGAAALQITPAAYQAMKWRLIGPFRGGRAVAVAGVPQHPARFYFGSVDGGVWKTPDAGRTWQPLWTHEPVASIGALAVAPSDPKVIYAGTGEADIRSDLSIGGGVYKSTDAGRTWSYTGLRETRQISKIVVDPANPDIVLVAALGHAYAPNPERGVFRSTDGGRTWKKTLFTDSSTGAIDLCLDPTNPQVVYAAMYNAHRVPWSTYPPAEGRGSGIYKSMDGGVTWKRLIRSGESGGLAHGLPAGLLGRIGIAVAYGAHHTRVYALIEARKNGGLYRSDDGGINWQRVSSDPRITERGWYFGNIVVDPKNEDVVYLPDVSLYRSTDGGRTFIAYKGAPGGDDYHALWIDPLNSNRMVLGSDQGTVVTLNDGKTWSSWYNQATAQFYHVAVDNQFPFRVYGGQQDSGSASVASRGNDGAITVREWHPVGAGESGYIAPDRSDPQIVYGGDTYGIVHRYDERTGQVQDVSPDPLPRTFGPNSNMVANRLRFTWTSPLVFSPQDPHVLYLGAQYVLETTDAGHSWKRISPDLTQTAASPSRDGVAGGIPEGVGDGVVYTIAPSPVRGGEIWAGTDNGLIQLTTNGGASWRDVTPLEIAPRKSPGGFTLPSWSKISLIEASHFDAGTAYAAVDRHRLDDYAPYIYRTHDYGKTWTKITDGIEAPAYVHAVREDPVQKGLLYAGTETGVYVSFDDGGHWQPLQLNLPTCSIRDLAIHDNELVVATHGRSFWILDDVEPLRQLSQSAQNILTSQAYLLQPEAAVRVRRDVNADTPLPPETSAGQNPPSGAILDYYLKSPPQGEITLTILGPNGIVREFKSGAKPKPVEEHLEFPRYWLRPPEPLTKNAGMNRFIWDLRSTPPRSISHDYTMHAVFGENTPAQPRGPLVLPGEYTVRLTIAGQNYDRQLEVKMDPRVTASPEDLKQEFDLGTRISRGIDLVFGLHSQIANLDSQLAADEKGLAGGGKLGVEAEIDDLRRQLRVIGAGVHEPDGPPAQGLTEVNEDLVTLSGAVGGADAAPTLEASEDASRSIASVRALATRWQQIKSTSVLRLNARLKAAGIPALKVP